VKFVPYNGNLIRINGINHNIPAAGITVAYNNCFINGVGGSTLTASNSYLVFAFIHATLGMQLDFCLLAVGHTASTQAGNIGTEIKTSDNSRTLVGILYSSGTATPFYDQNSNRQVRSWFNRRPAPMFAAGGGNFNALAPQVYSSVVAFVGEQVHVIGTWYGTADNWGNASLSLYLNGAGIGAAGYATTVHTTSAYENATAMVAVTLNEGFNQFGLYGSQSIGTTGGSCAISGMLG